MYPWQRDQPNPSYGYPVLYQEVAAHAAIRGVFFGAKWTDLEGDAIGSYDFSVIDTHLAECRKLGRQLAVVLDFRTYGGDPAVPAYMRNDSATYGGGVGTGTSKGGHFKTTTGYTPKFWVNSVRDRFIALVQALGTKYDRDPNFELIAIGETSVGQGAGEYTPTAGDLDAYFANLLAIGAATETAFPHTVRIQQVNHPHTILAKFVPELLKNGIGMGGPDLFSSTVVGKAKDVPPGNENFGLAGAGRAYTYYSNFAGKLPLGTASMTDSWTRNGPHQNPDANGPPAPLSALFEFARDSLQLNYIFWLRYITEVNGINRYKSELLPLLDSLAVHGPAGGLHSAYPSLY